MTSQPANPTSPNPPSPPAVPLWLLSMFTLTGPIAMHMLVPGLPHAARELGAGIGTMQLTISLYILGLAVGQLAYGPVSDRFGRRPVMMAGLALYSFAGIAAFLAPTVTTLVIARLMQALGGGAGMALSRAIIRDLGGQDIARRLALLTLMVTIGPAMAPVIGGFLSSAFGWRSIFLALSALGIVLILLLVAILKETRPSATQASAASIMKDYRELLKSPAFLGYAIGGGCATTAMYSFIASAPFILVEELHRPPHEVGIYLGLLVGGFSLGTIIAARLVPGFPIPRLLARSSLLSALASFFFLAVVLTSHLNVALVVLPLFVFTVGAGISSPMASSQALSVNPRIAGSASGLYGFAQMGIGALCVAFVSLGKDPALAAAIVLASASVIGQIAFWIGTRSRQPS